MARSPYIQSSTTATQHSQQGAAFIVMLIILVLGITTFFVSGLSTASLQNAQDKVTAEAMAQAKEALIGYAIKVQISNSNGCIPNCPRPGDLPCPDTNNDGLQESSCGNASGSTGQSSRIGRLPWKTLGLPDLRDGNGERLWYAVSNNFKYNTRSTTLLNGDTPGTISLYASNGELLNDGGAAGTGVAAVIIAPGSPLSRQDSGNLQDRSTANENNPVNYLDYASLGGNNHDNASFLDGSSSDGFIAGRIRLYDPATKSDFVAVNDQILPITTDSLLVGIQRRVAMEVKNCLIDYADNNLDRYPWATPLSDTGSTYNDNSDEMFGRIPDDFSDTYNDSSGNMDSQWGNCNTHNNNTPAGWWLNWREQVFYGLARRYRPNDTTASSFPAACDSIGRCLYINDTSTPARFVVIVAGKKLISPDQTDRNSNKGNAFYYLEGGNQNADPAPPSDVSNLFTMMPSNASFNDVLVYQ
ncbi:MAG: hypothetical protein FD121_969 [Gallionellaceae bacterium]|nr:MAG: hypothetical protein FD121_969 [Gallionellaceae bacterium]